MIEHATRAGSGSRRKHGSRLRLFCRQWQLQVMVLMGIGFLLVFSYLPMYGIVMAFQEYDLGDIPGMSPWVGLRHFKALIRDPNLPIILRNTLGISTLKLLFTFPAPIILALLFNEITRPRAKKQVQTVSYLPHFISWVVASAMIFDLLRVDGGSVNELLTALHILGKPVNFMGMPGFFWPLLVLSDLWKEVGWGSIIYVSAITAIDTEQYEAADIDGASRFQKMWYITLSSIKPTIIILLIFTVGGLLNTNFDQIMMLTSEMKNPMLMDVADVLNTYIYRVGLSLGRYSYATAAGLLTSLVNVLLLVGANWIAVRCNEEGVM